MRAAAGDGSARRARESYRARPRPLDLSLVGRFAHPRAREGHGAKAQARVEPFGSIVSKRAEKIVWRPSTRNWSTNVAITPVMTPWRR